MSGLTSDKDLPARFAAALTQLAPEAPFALGVSGGPDSTALMHLAAAWCRAAGAPAPLVLSVDHQLRAQSADECAGVARAAAALGLRAEVLVWREPKSSAGLQAHARKARHRLLAEAAIAQGCAALMLAHTQDDQIETVRMRAERRAGGPGAAGMPAQCDALDGLGPLRLVRPLLSTPKAALLSWLKALGIGFFVDPSNADRRFERVRARDQLPSEDILQEIDAATAARVAVERAALSWLKAEAVPVPGGWMVPREAMRPLRAEVLDCVLGALLRSAGGVSYPGTISERERLAAALCGPAPFSGRTLAGAKLSVAPRRLSGGEMCILFAPEKERSDKSLAPFWLPFGQYRQLEQADHAPVAGL